MSTRVCSPPSSIMDITRDIQGCPAANPTSGSLPVSSATQASSPSTPLIFGSGSTPTGQYLFHSVQSKNVAKCLFGPPDPRSGQYARDKVKEMIEQDKRKWEFDFSNERPLPGAKRFIWEAVNMAKKSESSTAGPVPKAYGLARYPFLSKQSATSTPTSTITSNSKISEREPLLIVQTARPSSPTPNSASTSTCPPPTPVKSTKASPERALSPDRLLQHQQHQQVSRDHPSSSSSQSSPEMSEEVNPTRNLEPICSIPSPPSSLEECSSPSSSIDTDTLDTLGSHSQELSEGQPLLSSKIKSQKTITQFMPTRKRPHTGTSSASAEKKAAL